MESKRKAFQGISNIVKFNWHYYLLSIVVLCVLYFTEFYFSGSFQIVLKVIFWIIVLVNLNSLFVSFYVYDVSNLYIINWIDKIKINSTGKIINVHAGFDETSDLLKQKYPEANFRVLDFYNPKTHTEISIKRARKSVEAFPNTIQINTSAIPIKDDEVDIILIFFAAHEIRKEEERIIFFKELKRILKPDGKIIVTEHVRDAFNFFAFNVGVFHFIPAASWENCFKTNGLNVKQKIKITPFVTSFIIIKNGIES